MFFEDHLNGTQLSDDVGESWQPAAEEEEESAITGGGAQSLSRSREGATASGFTGRHRADHEDDDDADGDGDYGENDDDGDAEGDDLLMRALTGASHSRSAAADRMRTRTSSSSKSLRPSPALVRSLIQHAESERYCPDLLVYPERLIDSVVARIAAKQEEIAQLANAEKEEASARYANAMESQAQGDKSGAGALPFKKSDLLAIEVQRVSFFLTELIRCRVRKIEKLCFTIAYADVVLRDLELERERRLSGKPRWTSNSSDNNSHRALLSQEREDTIRNACFLTLFDDAAGVAAGMPSGPNGSSSGNEAFSSSVTESRWRMEVKAVEAFAPPRLWQSVEPVLRSRSTALNSRTSRSSVGSTLSSEPASVAPSHFQHPHHNQTQGTMDSSAESAPVMETDAISYETLLSEEVLSYFQRLLASLSPNELVVARKLAQLRQQSLLDNGLRHFPLVLQSLTPYIHSSLCFSGLGREQGSHTSSSSTPSSAWLSSSRQWAPLGISASIGPLLWNRFTDACMCFTFLAEGEEILRRSNPSAAYVFVMTLEDLGEVDLGDGAVQQLRTGEMLLVPYSVMQSYVESGKACLV